MNLMKTRVKKTELGFSLIEMAVVLALTGFIALAVFMVVHSDALQVSAAELHLTLQESAREGLYKMTQELRESSSSTSPQRIVIGNPNNSVTFMVPDPSNPYNSDFSINWTGAQTINYALGGINNQQIIRTNQTTNTTKIIANDVVQLSFALTGRVMTLTLGVQKTMHNGRQVPDTPLLMSTEFLVRND